MKLSDIDSRIKGKLTPIGWIGTVGFGLLALGLMIADFAFVAFALIFAILAACSFAYARQKENP